MVAGLEEFDHPAWLTAVGTAVGWLLMLAAVAVLLFFLPYVLWP